MTYHKDGRINYRIIQRNDILEIAGFINKLNEQGDGRIEFSVDFTDGTSITDESIEIFDSSFFRRKDAQVISFEYRSRMCENYLKIQLAERTWLAALDNEYWISSEDETWFSATSEKLTDLLDGITRRDPLRKLFSFPWVLLTSALLIFPLPWAMAYILGFRYGEKPEGYEGIFISLPEFLVGAVLLTVTIGLIVYGLYPEVEFAFGSHRLAERKKTKKIIGWIVTAIVVPVALSLVL